MAAKVKGKPKEFHTLTARKDTMAYIRFYNHATAAV